MTLLRWLARFALPGLLCVLLGVVIGGRAIPPSVLSWFRVGYREHANALLEKREIEAALAELERCALIDRERWDLLQRLERANRSAKFQSVLSPYVELASGDAELRFRVGMALLGRLDTPSRSGERELRLFERAIANAGLLLAVESRRPRSYYLSGRTRLLLAKHFGSERELSLAIRNLERTLAMSPTYPGAREALDEAKRIRSTQRTAGAG